MEIDGLRSLSAADNLRYFTEGFTELSELSELELPNSTVTRVT